MSANIKACMIDFRLKFFVKILVSHCIVATMLSTIGPTVTDLFRIHAVIHEKMFKTGQLCQIRNSIWHFPPMYF